jgi:ribosomal protein L7/L12
MDLSDEFCAEIRSLLEGGRKIDAIRRYREETGADLKQAKDAVEAIERGEAAPTVEPPSEEFEREILQLMESGQKIEAIKLYRQQTGRDLKAAKDAVEALAARHHVCVPQGRGCLGVVLVAAAVVVAILLG